MITNHNKIATGFGVACVLAVGASSRAAVVPIAEDVMTSSFFTGTDLVRGHAGDNRPTMRVSTPGAFGLAGAETIYLTFDYDFRNNFAAPVPQALLTIPAIPGGFGADASAVTPFTLSAHAVNANPLTSITDNTNPTGLINWLDFYNNNILAAAPAARTSITGTGTYTLDVTKIVNDWIAGTNTVYAIALTGKNDTSGVDILQGFSNNNNTLPAAGTTFLTTVPEPGSATVGLLAAAGLAAVRRRRRS